jgi:alpha-1,3/alpha-1,6-mannosyltransferase
LGTQKREGLKTRWTPHEHKINTHTHTGAERLIVDAAVELAERGHAVSVCVRGEEWELPFFFFRNRGRLTPLSQKKKKQVTIFTPHHDPARCFPETTAGAFTVTVAGSWFPRTIAGRGAALCALVRCALAACALAWAAVCGGWRWDALVADQVAGVVPLLHALTAWRSPVLFYCHFPDLLLASRPSARAGSLASRAAAAARAAYRAPLDALEQAATGCADALLVNSRFTAGVFAATFTRLAARGVAPGILYPAAAVPSDAELAAASGEEAEAVLPADVAALIRGRAGSSAAPPVVFTSINRFERKKDIGLAIRALAVLVGSGGSGGRCQQQKRRAGGGGGGGGGAAKTSPSTTATNAVLVIAGGYDPRLAENVEHLAELRALAASQGVAGRVAFLPSFSDAQRAALLARTAAILYTPSGEHFGIVPVEAGAAGVPVIAVASGGPLESVVDGRTGWLVRPDPASFAGAMAGVVGVGTAGARASVGAAARRHVRAHFSRTAFGAALEAEVLAMVDGRRGAGGKAERAAPPRASSSRRQAGKKEK